MRIEARLFDDTTKVIQFSIKYTATNRNTDYTGGITRPIKGLRRMNPAEAQFWTAIDRLVADCEVVIDRPAGSPHPNYPDMIYPLDYGYLEGTLAADGGGIDVWIGSGARHVTGVIVTVDLVKQDCENKILLGCTEAEVNTIIQFMSDDMIGCYCIRRP